ncbi:hypothetical protein [Bacteroides sp.]|uniref:hypothetical protein n=1 Tax=Bacteroides sp. TaxID=29523 RepID=UPI0026324192|nr:hypothetical protein [Bacteroides sp.]
MKTETTAPQPTTDRKGKIIRWASVLSAKSVQRVQTAKSESGFNRRADKTRADHRHAAGYLRRKYRSLLGNFPSRNTPYR